MDICRVNPHAYSNRLIRYVNNVFKMTSVQKIKFGI